MKTTENKAVVSAFIESVWNNRNLDAIDKFISDEYQDYSFLPAVPPTKEGLRFWIKNTSAAFDHHTSIESIVAEGDEVAVRILFGTKHIGKWRGIEPTRRKCVVKGFRFFKLKDEKIVAHWALIDGEALQTALTDMYSGCALPS